MMCREDILSEIEKELDYMLSNAPESLPESSRKNIKDEFTEYTQRVLDSLSREELQSASAYERFIETTLAHARMRMHLQ